MRRIAALLLILGLLSAPGCQVVTDMICGTIFGGLAEKYDTSRPPSERRAAYDRMRYEADRLYMREHADR